MARRIRIFFATDVHGSEKCFRKFLNGGRAYQPDVLVLGGDIAGKAIQAIVDLGSGHFTTHVPRAPLRRRRGDPSSRRVERLIADLGYYPWRAKPGELERTRGRRHDRGAARRLDAASGSRAGWRSPTSGSGRSASPRSACSATTIRPSSAMRSTRRPGADTPRDTVLAIDDYELVSLG